MTRLVIPIVISCLLVLSEIRASLAADPPKTRYGYADTAYLPGGKWRVHDINRPLPPVVTPGPFVSGPAPSDAVVLFDGKDMSQWNDVKDGKVSDGSFDVKQTGEIRSKQEFGDCQAHVEWKIPKKSDGDWATWGNSGVYVFGLYEIQIIQTEIYADGISGAIYGQTPPLVQAMRPPGAWQSFDIVATAPKFHDGKLLAPACFTVFMNGVLVQNHQAAIGPTRHRDLATYDNQATRGPILLQYHGSAVRFRNIWVRPLRSAD